MKKIILASFLILGAGLFLSTDAALAISAPILVAPDDGATFPPGEVTLQWSVVPDANKGYHYYISDPNGDRKAEQNNYKETQVTFRFASKGTYRWRVQSCKSTWLLFTDCSDWSQRSFTIAPSIPIPKPVLSLPEPNATVASLTPTLQWIWSGNRLQRYYVEIGGDLGTSETQKTFYSTQNYFNVPATALDSDKKSQPFLKYGKTYSWRVLAEDKNGDIGPWSELLVFLTPAEEATLHPPFLYSPVSGQPPVYTLTPNLIWYPRTGAKCYEAQIKNVWSGKTPGTLISVPGGNLSDGQIYQWTARASAESCDVATNYSDWSGLETFSVKITTIDGAIPPPPPDGDAIPAPDSTGGVGRTCPVSIKSPSVYKTSDNKYVAYDGLVPCGKCVIVGPSEMKDAQGKPTGKYENAQGYTEGGKGQYVSCQFCHFFVMFYGMVDFLIWKITLPLAILLMVIGGATFVFSAGQPGSIKKGKDIMTSVAIGLAIIFAAYLVVGAFLNFLGLADWTWQIYKDWSRGFFQFNCPINI